MLRDTSTKQEPWTYHPRPNHTPLNHRTLKPAPFLFLPTPPFHQFPHVVFSRFRAVPTIWGPETGFADGDSYHKPGI